MFGKKKAQQLKEEKELRTIFTLIAGVVTFASLASIHHALRCIGHRLRMLEWLGVENQERFDALEETSSEKFREINRDNLRIERRRG